MAKIELKVGWNGTAAETGIKNLQSTITALNKSFSSIKVNSELTTQIKSLTEYYKQLTTTISQANVAEKERQTMQAKQNSDNQKQIAQIDNLRKSYANLYSAVKRISQIYANNGTFEELSKDVGNAFTEIRELSKALKDGEIDYKEAADDAERLSKTYKELSANAAVYKATTEKAENTPLVPTIEKNLNSLKKGYSDLITQIKGNEQYYKEGLFDNITESAKNAIPQIDGLLKSLQTNGKLTPKETEKLNKLTSALDECKSSTAQLRAENENMHGSLLEIIQGFIKFQASATIVMTALNLVRNAWQSLNDTIVETENYIVELQRVLPSGTSSTDISSGLYSLAEEYGQSLSDVSDVVSRWAKTGKDLNESLTAAKATLLAMNVAELDSEQATEGLVAIMSQFGYTVDDLSEIIDKLNKVADENPVTTEELLTALQKMGSYAKQTNTSLEESISLITTLSKATAASGSNIGNALKSLFSYSTKSSSLDTFASLSDETANVVEKYRQGGATILEVWRTVANYMNSLGDKQTSILSTLVNDDDWNNLNDELEGELEDIYTDVTGVYDTAGTYRKNYFIALLNDIDNVDGVLEDMNDAIGYSAEENATAMDTYEKKLAVLQAKWQEICNDEQGLLGIKKELVDIASALLDFQDNIGGIHTLLLAVGTAAAIAFGDKLTKLIDKAATHITNNLIPAATTFESISISVIGWIGIASTLISAAIGAYNSYVQELEEARQANIDLWKSEEENALKLAKLSEQLGDTNLSEEENKNLQNDIVDLLGDRAKALDTLEQGTEDYTTKLKELTKAEIENYRISAQSAANSATEKFNDYGFLNFNKFSTISNLSLNNGVNSLEQAKYIRELATQAGLFAYADGAYDLGSIKSSGNKFTDYAAVLAMLTAMSENGLADTGVYTDLANYYSEIKSEVEDYVNTVATSKIYNNLSTNENGIDTQAEVDELVKQIQTATGATDEWAEYIETIVLGYADIAESADDTSKAVEKTKQSLADLSSDELNKVLEQIKTYREEQELIEEIEEKQAKVREAQADYAEKELAVEEKKEALLEAEKALQDAMNTRSVQRFNSATGVLEWQQDDQAVKDAQDKVNEAAQDVEDAIQDLVESQEKIQDAMQNLQDFLMDKAFEDIYTALGTGSTDEATIWGILGKWNGYNLGSDEWIARVGNAVGNAVSGIISGYNFATAGSGSSGNSEGTTTETTVTTTGVYTGLTQEEELKKSLSVIEQAKITTNPDNATTAKKDFKNKAVYDSGGIANGIGYMPKDVVAAEMVLPPDTTAQLLNPENLDNIDRVSKSLGLLFANSQKAFGGATTTPTKAITDNRNYSTNGVYLGNVQIGSGNQAESLLKNLRDLRILS